MDTTELLSASAPLIGDMGSAFYFIPETGAVGKELGLKGMEFYVLGRGGSMGDCDGRAVAAAFGYFKPSMLQGIWAEASAKVAPRTAGRAHLECCANLGRAKLSAVPNLAAFVAAAGKVNDAADPDGLALYAAMKTEELAADDPGRAMQLIALLREFRGSAHLVALRAVGIESRIAHFIKRPDMFAVFGYGDDEKPAVTDAHHQQMAEAEALTDRMVEPAFAVLGQDERSALVEGLRNIKVALKAE